MKGAVAEREITPVLDVTPEIEAFWPIQNGPSVPWKTVVPLL